MADISCDPEPKVFPVVAPQRFNTVEEMLYNSHSSGLTFVSCNIGRLLASHDPFISCLCFFPSRCCLCSGTLDIHQLLTASYPSPPNVLLFSFPRPMDSSPRVVAYIYNSLASFCTQRKASSLGALDLLPLQLDMSSLSIIAWSVYNSSFHTSLFPPSLLRIPFKHYHVSLKHSNRGVQLS